MNLYNPNLELLETTKVIKTSYITALLLIAILSIGNYFVISTVMKTQSNVTELKAEVIKHEGLYHRIKELVSLALNQGSSNIKSSLHASMHLEFITLIKQLKQNRRNIEKAINRKQSRLSQWMGFPQIISNSITILPDYSKAVESQLEQFLLLDSPTIRWYFATWSPLALTLANQGTTLNNINKVNRDLQYKSTNISQESAIIHKVLMVTTLFTLLLEYLFIFRPLVQRLSSNYKEIKSVNAKLKYQATHEDMTMLGNRQFFIETLQQNKKGSLVLFLIDLRDFKNINDVYGNEIGDQVLQIISSRLKNLISNNSSLYRLGGDQFAIITKGMGDIYKVEQLAYQIISDMAKPIPMKKNVILMRCAIGINIVDQKEKMIDIAKVLKELNFSLRTAKKSEQLRFNIFNTVDMGHSTSKAQLSSQISNALEKKEIQPYYQPIINMQTGEIIGAEALARWVTREGGIISPAEFLPLIDELNLMNNLTEIILEQVSSDYNKLLALGIDSKFISVNFPESILLDPELPMKISYLLGSKNLDYLHVEILETALLHESSHIIETNLQALIEWGVHISLDDFGTGYASLSHLLDFPCHTIKIDRCFVANIAFDSNSELITRGIIDIALGLGKSLIAEGIETKKQCDFFSEWPEISGPGYLFHRPQPFSDFVNLFERK